jgi:three-Cys-motif partner protein
MNKTKKPDKHTLMLDHSKAKVNLYGNYLARYLRIISQDRYTQKIHLYDMFAGEGKYDNSGGEGSPVVALKKIASCLEQQPNMPKINLTFNDIDKDIVNKLKASTSNIVPSNCFVRYFNDDYLNLVGTVEAEIKALKDEKSLIFLDPKGYKEIAIADLKRLINGGKSEVLVFLPIRDMYRFADMDRSKAQPAHEALIKFIDEAFGKNMPAQFESQVDFINQLRIALKRIMKNTFVDTFYIEPEAGQFFAMFFFTSHIYGFEKMLETKWDIDKEQGRAFRYEQTGTMFSGSEVLDFPKSLCSFLSEEKRYNGQVYEFALHEGFLPKHVNEVLKDLYKRGTLQILSDTGSTIKGGATYISYDHYRNEARKVYFRYDPNSSKEPAKQISLELF